MLAAVRLKLTLAVQHWLQALRNLTCRVRLPDELCELLHTLAIMSTSNLEIKRTFEV